MLGFAALSAVDEPRLAVVGLVWPNLALLASRTKLSVHRAHAPLPEEVGLASARAVVVRYLSLTVRDHLVTVRV